MKIKSEILFTTPHNFITIKKAPNCSFFYSERKGIDSVSIVLVDKERQLIGLTNETKPPFNEREQTEMAFKTTAMGGSLFDMISSEKDYLDMSFDEQLEIATETAKKETKEEMGFDVSDTNVKFQKRVVFDSMSNEYVWLFVIEVDKSKKGDREPQNKLESMASNVWVSFDDITSLEDGKAKATLLDYFINEKILKV